MKILVMPMFALSSMSGPWSRAQKIASAFQAAGHEAILGFTPDGNCRNPVTARVLDVPVPSPLGAPMAIAKRTFPLATRLGIAGRKPVRSFEEVLWLTGNLAYDFASQSVSSIRDFIRKDHVDVVYSEFSLPAILAAKSEGVPLVGTASYPAQASYACSPTKAKGIRRLLDNLGLPSVNSSLELFERMDLRFVPSCSELEPFESTVTYCGFLQDVPRTAESKRDSIVFYLGTGTVPKTQLIATVFDLARNSMQEIYVAGIDERGVSGKTIPSNLHLAHRFDFAELLPHASAFINHGGQNSIMDGLSHGAPQIVYPGKVFERIYNAHAIQSAGAGIALEEFNATAIEEALVRLEAYDDYRARTQSLCDRLASLGGVERIVAQTEKLLAS